MLWRSDCDSTDLPSVTEIMEKGLRGDTKRGDAKRRDTRRKLSKHLAPSTADASAASPATAADGGAPTLDRIDFIALLRDILPVALKFAADNQLDKYVRK